MNFICFVCLEGLSHEDDSFEYQQLMFQLRIRNLFELPTLIKPVSSATETS